MANIRSKPVALCEKCKKPLQLTACSACDGKGYQREWLLFKRDCEVCQGTGRVLRCPDAYQHALDSLKAFKGINPSPISPAKWNGKITSLSSNSLKTRVPPKQPQVPPPWLQPNNPMNPNSPLNPNNPLNPNSLRNPNNPNSPLYKNPFKK